MRNVSPKLLGGHGEGMQNAAEGFGVFLQNASVTGFFLLGHQSAFARQTAMGKYDGPILPLTVASSIC